VLLAHTHRYSVFTISQMHSVDESGHSQASLVAAAAERGTPASHSHRPTIAIVAVAAVHR